MIKLTLPYPPTVNHYWGVRGTRRFIKKQGLDFRKKIKDIIDKDHGNVWLEGRLSIRLIVHPPDNRRRDLDNLLKATLDALEEANLFEDDSQFDFISLERKGLIRPEGKLIVHIQEI